MAPGVSVIIPCYNEGERLAGTLEAIREFSSRTTEFGDGIEWIFVDDGSTDETLRLIEAHAAADPGVRVVALASNRGKGAAIVGSAGLKAMKGP